MKKFKVKIRGIYSTALTKLLLDYKKILGNQIPTELLLDNGFDIVQPSVTLRERFRLKENDESPDLEVYDRNDQQGVQAFGTAESVNAFNSMLQSCLDDIVVRKWAVTADGIYKGLIREVDPETSSFLIDIGPAVGKIAQEEISDPTLKQMVVQVERGRIGAKEPVLTTGINIPGKYAILIPGKRVRVSRKIRDQQTRLRLYQLGKELTPPNWGILWRTASADQPSEVLKNEINSLTKKEEAVMEKAEHVEAPATLWQGSHYVDVEFPALSKKELDDVRGSVAPTIDGHHYYKACGGNVSSALDMAEKLLEKGSPREEVESLFKQTIRAEYPIVGSVIGIEHVKLDGKVFHLGKALIETYNHHESLISLRRVFEKKGIYDGLKTEKNPGDYAVTEAKIGGWHLKTEYFAKDGRYKGTYINLNTPIELYPHGIRYVDLEIDVCVWPNGRIKKLDEEKLEEASEEGMITQRLVKIVKEKLQEIMKVLP